MKKIAVIGCPRSGTRFIATFLRRCEIDVLHEKIGDDGTSSWYAAPALHMAGASFSINGNDFEINIVHQVRNPLHAIPSMLTINRRSWLYARMFTAGLRAGCGLAAAMDLWVQWNLLCDAAAKATYQVESLTSERPLRGFFGAIGRAYQDRYLDAMRQMPTDINSRKHSGPTTVEELRAADPDLAGMVCSLGRRYGYAM